MKRGFKLPPGFLDEPMDRIVLITCPNTDWLHGKDRFVITAIVFGNGMVVDWPNVSTVTEILRLFHLPKVVIMFPCVYCRQKGIIGPVTQFDPNDPDPYHGFSGPPVTSEDIEDKYGFDDFLGGEDEEEEEKGDDDDA